MRRLLSGIALSVLLVAPAFAADMPVKAQPVPVAAPPLGWTGLYAGLNFGYGWGRQRFSDVVEHDSGGTDFFYRDFSFNANGFMSGAQVGYNWQVGAWLLGFETDFQLATVDGKTRFDRAIFDLGPSAFHTDVATNLKYFGTARLRAGYLITPAVLAYATGGLAYGRVESSLAFPAVSGAPNTFFDSETHWHTGWTVGGGLEAKVSDRGTLKVEYLYADLGTERPTFFIANDFYNWNQRIDLHVVRLGFNVLLLPVTR